MNSATSVSLLARLLPASLAGKITLGFSVIGLLLVVNLGNSYLDSMLTNRGLDRMVSEALPVFSDATSVAQQVQQLEPVVLTLLETETTPQLQQQQNTLSQLSAAIDRGLAATLAEQLSEPLASAVAEAQTDLTRVLSELNDTVRLLEQSQQQLIETRQQIAAVSETLQQQEQELTPLLNDIVYEMDDDYLISLMFEFSASANAGQVIIAKIRAASEQGEISELQNTLEVWIKEYKSLLRGLPISAGSDPALYRELLTQLSAISDVILASAQGSYDDASNGYINGLQSIKSHEIALLDQQQANLQEFRRQLSAALGLTQTLVETGGAEMNSSADNIQQLLAAQQRLSLFSGVFGIALVFVISLLLIRYFQRSVALLRDDLTQLEQGQLTSTQNSQRRDEFGQLIRAVHRVTEGLRDIVSGIGHANAEIHQGVERVSLQATNTRDNVEGQKQELDQVATALTEMSATASEVANHASDTHQKVGQAGELSSDGRAKVGGSRDMIVQVSEQAERTKAVIDSLNEGVQGIESILTTIGGIAEQTNLLALNAAIEAARAGEQGRGFAVVADEVRALASRTQASTQEIQQMTDSMLTESNEAVQVMERSAKLISESVDSAQQADEAIVKFDQVMNEVLDLSHLIATASEEQALTVNELNSNVLRVSTLAEETQESAESSQMTSDQLATMANTLQQKVSRFRLE